MLEPMEWIDTNDIPCQNRQIRKYLPYIIVGGVCFITLLCGIIYTAMSKTVYFWDDATYWEISRMLADEPLGIQFVKDIYHSMVTSDYNYLPALVVSLWMRIFGGTRLSYIIAITVLYLIPTEIMIYKMCAKHSKAKFLAFVMTVISIPALSYLTFIGFIDVGGVLIGISCYYLYFGDGFKKCSWLKNVILGVLLAIIMLFRRYFAFFTVSFVTVMVLDSILFKCPKRETIITIASLGGVIGILFLPFVTNILLQDYGNLYSGYKYNVFTDFKLITRYFGLLFLAMTILAVPYTIKRKKDVRCVFPLLQMLICMFMFVTTQTHGQQHLLLYIPGLVMLVIFGLNAVNNHYVLIGVCCVGLITFISPLIPRTQPNNIQEIKGLALAPTYSVKAEKREDINQILALKNKLDKTIPDGKTCGVLSSSFTLNANILLNVEPSLNRNTIRNDKYIVGLPEVDSRDWWRLEEIYTCDYILVATPAQTHLAEGQQKIITETVSSFVNGTDIAEFYGKVDGFDVRIGEVAVTLYKRVGDVSETAKTKLRLRFDLKEG